ncbi:MAG: hypothetical protein JO048_07300 [Methylobacteriaceae bacterium]|nr:hypothetical protein [Methylobacteriaceae bacterium]
MVDAALGTFVDRLIEAGEIGAADVARLASLLPAGIGARQEADILIALDKAVAAKDPAWDAFLVPALVDFVLRSSRPHGRVDRATAEWLTTSLGCGAGPSDNALAVAFAVVRRSELCHEVLVSSVMGWARGLKAGALARDWGLAPA